jgi:hypothetical protein
MPRSIPRWVIWMLAILLAVAVSIGAIVFFDPLGAAALMERLRAMLNGP